MVCAVRACGASRGVGVVCQCRALRCAFRVEWQCEQLMLPHGDWLLCLFGPRCQVAMEASALLEEAQKGGFWSYACGTVRRLVALVVG